MDLWTEYEGRTIAGDYYLETLLRSEGRSAFFKTAGKPEGESVIRLTEAHFDEDEMIRRWQQVAAVEQANLIEIRKVGQTTLDGVALAFALLEPSDANLEDVLKERPLTEAETLQVARAVVSAVSALHGNGLVHEHITPANVLAVGETVKLRSDCVRECVVDMEFSTAQDCEELRKGDVHAIGVLLLQCLTLARELQPGTTLPKPLAQVIHGAIQGTMTPQQMSDLLEPPPIVAAPAAPATAPVYGQPARATGPAAGSASSTAPVYGEYRGESKGEYRAETGAGTAGASRPEPLLTDAATRSAPAAPQPAPPARAVPRHPSANGTLPPIAAPAPEPLPEAVPPAPHFRPRNDTGLREHKETSYLPWVMGAVALLAVVLLLWHFLGGSKPAAGAAVPAASTTSTAAAVAGRPAAAKPSAAAPSEAPRVVTDGPAASRSGWYVVVYTYNREDQAKNKVAQIRRVHNSLHPQVFAPGGHSPYLVTLGGPMSNKDAGDILRRARRAGMPRDTFIRNY